MSHSILLDLYINATKSKVFDAFTLPEHLDNWWALKSSGEPILGAEYNLNFTDKYNWYAEVLKVKQNESFFLKMITSSEEWQPTTFGIELEDTDTGTLLKFSHKDWQHNTHEFRNSSFCWAMLLNGLKNYIEKGIVIPFNERN
ncbi:MAG: SRPBCC domain-containing protein [Winogradskyella sp.]|uniref:SRPBCC family protein n=1 Tax=Winogradskyella sp. TaxID=1883156 RepID=UPI000F3EB082|nr:SRPBCC domain-containing protein [Winogradskyella sp.]RNC86790.1 MAG: SRPBCC domain-containing protein [Winogradskyella sp.]